MVGCEGVGVIDQMAHLGHEMRHLPGHLNAHASLRRASRRIAEPMAAVMCFAGVEMRIAWFHRLNSWGLWAGLSESPGAAIVAGNDHTLNDNRLDRPACSKGFKKKSASWTGATVFWV